MDPENYHETNQKWAGRFFSIWFGQAFSILGSHMVSFALIWWLTRETGSAAVLASSSIIAFLPRIFISPFAGALVDRWNRRLVMIIADSAIAAATLLLAFLFWTGAVQTWHILGLLFIRSIGGVFHGPAMFATTSLMVPQKHLARVAGANQILDGGINVAGPALGALLMELLPIQGVLAIDVGTAMLAVLPLLFIAVPQPSNGKEKPAFSPKILLQEVVEGFRYVVTWRGMLIVVIYSVLLNFVFSPSFTFLPLLVTEHFNGSAWQLGLLQSLIGAGMLAGGLLLSVWGGFKRKIAGLLVGLGGLSLALVVVGVAPASAFSLAAGAFLFSGVANTIMNGSANVVLQTVVAPDMQGRVISMLTSSATALQPLALLLATPIVDLFGTRILFIVSGLVGIVAALLGFYMPDLMRIEEQHKPVQETQPDRLAETRVAGK